ncbi:MAG: ATP-binding protein [Mariprofundaceae bacterium]
MLAGFRWGGVLRLFTGYADGKAQDEDFQCRVIALVASISTPTLAIFSIVNYLHGHTGLSIIEATVMMLMIPCFKVLNNPASLPLAKNLLMLNATIVFSAVFIDGGVAGTGLLWALVLPPGAFLLMGLPAAWYWVISFAIILSTSVAAHVMGLISLPYNNTMLAYFPAVLTFFALIGAAFEMQLESLRANLEEKVLQRTTDLQNANIKLTDEINHHQNTADALKDSEANFYQAQKMDAVGTLVGGIAHDFNNMLSGISANMFLIKRKANGNPEVAEYVGSAELLIKSAADMIRQLLTFARKDNVEYKTFNLLPFISEAYKLAGVSIPPKIKLKYDFPNQELWVKANGTQLQQVLMNLINNSRDAVKKSKEPCIKVSLVHFDAGETFKTNHPELINDSFAKLTVSDNGYGIEKDKVEKIFEPFFTTKEAGEGTGLGLAMCYGAIQGHGGTIEVDSTPNEGTSFHIYLPIYAESDETIDQNITHDAVQEAVRGNGEYILLADDDPILGKIQTKILTTLGYHVIQASNGKEAIEKFEEQSDKIDLVILDVMMPVMGGVEAAAHIRKIKTDIRIIFATGYDKEDSLNGAHTPDAGDFILDKPFTIDELSHAVQKQLLSLADN